MKNSIDKIHGSALPFAQVASKPRVKRRNLTEMQVFLCPTDERLSGGQGYTTPFWGNPCAVPFHGFEPPGTFESANSKKKRRITMASSNVLPFRRPAPVPSSQLPDICSIAALPDEVISDFIKQMAMDDLRVELFAFLCCLCAHKPILPKPNERFRWLIPGESAIRVPQQKHTMEV